MAAELEAARLRRLLQPVKMFVKVGDPFVGVEPHRFFKVALMIHDPIIGPRTARRKPAIARVRACS